MALLQVEKITPLSEALLLLDSADQTAALVLDDSQNVTGVLTRDKIIAALEAEAECKVADSDAGTGEEGGCVVDLVISAGEKTEK